MSKFCKLKAILSRAANYIINGVPIKQISANISVLHENELLKDRGALITGGSSGIGKEIAKSFVNAGAKVVITGRDEEKLRQSVDEIENSTGNKKRTYALVMDNSQTAHLEVNITKVVAMIGDLSILVNNAGTINFKNFGNTTEDDYDRIMNTNLKGTYFLSQTVAKYMVQKGIEGNILNIASSSSLRPANSPYALSKWGIKGLTIGLARVLTPHNIVVNGIAPGPTVTPMLGFNNEKNIVHDRNLSGRHCTPEEIANMATILVSDMSRMIVGDIIYMSGGSGVVITNDIDYSF